MSQSEYIHVETTQNVKLHYEVSAIGDRLFAYIIDYLIMHGFALIVFLLYNYTVRFDSSEGNMIIGIVLVLLVPGFYHLIFELFNSGQSIGKKLLKIKVIRLDGTEPTLGNYLIRWLTRIIEMQGIFGLGLIVILINGKGQRIGDLAAGTTVAKVKKRLSIEDTVVSKTDSNYVPEYPQVQQLSAKDIEIIKEALHHHAKYENFNLINTCGMKVKTLFGLDPYSTKLPNHDFLQRVVDDFNYYQNTEHLPTF